MLLAQSHCALGQVDAGAKTVAELRGRVDRHVAVFEPHFRLVEAWLAAAQSTLPSRGSTLTPWDDTRGWRTNGHARRELTLRWGEVRKQVLVEFEPDGYAVTLDGERGPIVETDAQVVVAGAVRHVFLEGGISSSSIPIHLLRPRRQRTSAVASRRPCRAASSRCW